MLQKAISTSQKIITSTVEPLGKYDFEQSEWKRKFQLVRFFCFLLLATLGLAIILYLSLTLLSGQLALLWGVPVCFLLILLSIFSFRQARRGRLVFSSNLLVSGFSGLILFDYGLLGAEPALYVGLFIPIGLAIALLDTRSVVIVTGFATVFVSLMYLCEFILRLYRPLVQLTPETRDMCNLVSVQLMIPVIVALLVLPARNQLQVIKNQATFLRQTLHLLEARQQTSQQVSQQVLSLATQLSGSATQWASGSVQQAAVAIQVNDTMGGLSGSAANIARLAEQVSRAAGQMAQDSQIIEETTNHSVSKSESGIAAVSNTIQVSAEVAGLYQDLLDSITELKTKNANTRLILNLLREIAGQTHLLSLNAAIEAAGASQGGERFRAVAQEVRQLAARSSDASKQVVELVKEIELATDRALNAAQTGKLRAAHLEMIANQTGEVIEEMRAVVQESQNQSSAINLSAEQVRKLSLVIKDATDQQLTASEHILDILSGLSNVAAESAEGSRLITNNAGQLTELSEELQLALAGVQ